ncbi:uncharacterized protein MONOS_301 [Monocercomonoides exilis]|uniref:uncharacterized protein n=1 Tax=Monocercomonoides exilis TaxID=2049356 RepID=UPI003559C42C|nr:hypothetical protein MONOS_301 [Monocercomonoides exilis]|eukprot:MONOS_301.1-p1 / transcript=MONOS_301.1 / gene=MONOS_301 / organism=Monocercomonoides_exilis_PA203 / gene_product=unspecified product / transcript_product=unspecified product / location=Mono_scaffold00005:79853-80374(+) / protein_length=142 / sequence_SO=supercontig / SO=protein_coding / is_pseudo=false
MIEERKISMENALVLLKQIGYCNVLMDLWSRSFEESSLKKKIEKLKVEEEEKKEEKNEMLLVDLCECYVSLSYHLSCIGQRGKREDTERSGNCFAGVEQHSRLLYRTKTVFKGNQRNYRISSETLQLDSTCVSICLEVFDG